MNNTKDFCREANIKGTHKRATVIRNLQKFADEQGDKRLALATAAFQSAINMRGFGYAQTWVERMSNQSAFWTVAFIRATAKQANRATAHDMSKAQNLILQGMAVASLKGEFAHA